MKKMISEKFRFLVNPDKVSNRYTIRRSLLDEKSNCVFKNGRVAQF